MKALYIASTGMAAQERNVEVISNNIANMRTTGYKRQRAEFQDLLYQQLRRAGSPTSDAGHHRAGRRRDRLGRAHRRHPARHEPGHASSPTEKELDVAVRGEGFFTVDLPDGRTAYTRDGSFERSATGELVNVDGYQVQPGIIIPDNANSLSISADGIGRGLPRHLDHADRSSARSSWRASSTRPASSRWATTCSSRPPRAARPRSARPTPTAWATLLQGYLEAANVNSVTEIADLIAAQRAYEMNARVISGADEMMQATASLS